MSDTPRTDAAIAKIESEIGDGPPHISSAAVDVCVRHSLIATCRQLERELAAVKEQLAEARSALTWIEGCPTKPWCNEWFIARTTFRDRVVLTALPEEYSYDFKTADDTYIKADKILCWMQFPDSQYIAAPADQWRRVEDVVTVDKTAWEGFVSEYDRYNEGDPKLPFSELRHSLAIVIESAKPLPALPESDK